MIRYRRRERGEGIIIRGLIFCDRRARLYSNEIE